MRERRIEHQIADTIDAIARAARRAPAGPAVREDPADRDVAVEMVREAAVPPPAGVRNAEAATSLARNRVRRAT